MSFYIYGFTWGFKTGPWVIVCVILAASNFIRDTIRKTKKEKKNRKIFLFIEHHTKAIKKK